MWILKNSHTVINIDNENDVNSHVNAGWEIVSDLEIAAYGMAGYEHIVGPHNTVVNADGSITFTPPEPPSAAELVEQLRAETERRLAATDKYATVDFPGNALREKMLTYRADLRALNRQPGAPWDGGGDDTPWPTIPQL